MGHNYQDAALSGLFTVSAATEVGIADVTLLGYQLSDTMTTIAGFDLSLAFLLSLGALLGAWIINKPNWDALSDEKKMLVGATVAIVLAGTFIPEVTANFTESVVIALAVLGIEAGGYWAIAQSG